MKKGEGTRSFNLKRGKTMKCRFRCAFLILSVVFILSQPGKAVADSAEVLPKGVSRISVDYSFYQPVTDRFGPGGDAEGVATDFNTTIDETVFPGVIPTFTNIGDTVVDFEYEFRDLIINYQYGLSDKITIGVKIPYYWNKTNLKEARVDTSGATQPVLDGLLGAGFPAGASSTDAAVTALVLGSLEAPPYSFEPFESWDDAGLSDIELGLRYQYLKNDEWRLAFTGGLRLPTGETDDPDNLIDTEFGSGAMALLFRFNQDYVGIENLLLNFTVKYDWVLPDEETVRVLNGSDMPLAPAANKEKVDRDQGDTFALELYGDWSVSDIWSVNALYTWAVRQKDEVDGNLFPSYDALEDETDADHQSITAGVTYSTVSRYMDEKASVPLEVGLSYESVFAGNNNYLKQQLYTLNFAIYF